MQYLNSTISPRLSQFLYCFLQHYFFFSSARVAFLPQMSHLPSSVMQGCLGASPPHNPHFGIPFTSFPDGFFSALPYCVLLPFRKCLRYFLSQLRCCCHGLLLLFK